MMNYVIYFGGARIQFFVDMAYPKKSYSQSDVTYECLKLLDSLAARGLLMVWGQVGELCSYVYLPLINKPDTTDRH